MTFIEIPMPGAPPYPVLKKPPALTAHTYTHTDRATRKIQKTMMANERFAESYERTVLDPSDWYRSDTPLVVGFDQDQALIYTRRGTDTERK